MVVINCHLPCIRVVQILMGYVLNISFIANMILVGMCFFSVMQPFSAAKFVMSVFPFFDASH